MSERHPLGPDLEVFSGQDGIAGAEQRVAADLFSNIIGDSLLHGVAHLQFKVRKVFDDDVALGEYTTTDLLLKCIGHEESNLSLHDGYLQVALQTVDTNNPIVSDGLDPVAIRVTYFDSQATEGAKVVYRLGRDGVVRREDITDASTPADEAEAQANMAAINAGDEAAWDRELERQLRNSKIRQENTELEAAMNVNRQPVGVNEIYWLSEVLRFSEPQG